MQSIAVEYLRFGDDVGIARLSEEYLRTVQSGELATVKLGLPQAKLDAAMQRLVYANFRRADTNEVRQDAEGVLSQLAPRLEQFLPEIPKSADGEKTQIEVVTQALELAQLPFEVLEDKHNHLVITRRIRLPWPRPPVTRDIRPRVLFAWAEPRRMTVPHERHLALLGSFLNDWQGSLDVLENASLDALRERIRSEKNGYTHIYVLAHGVGQAASAAAFNLDEDPPPGTYLGLQDGDDVCRCTPKDLEDMFDEETRRPAAFVLATCDSGGVDSIQTGGTLAHALHRAGVPVVVASQFELTKKGSDRLIDVFLKMVVLGEDPRVALRKCRDELRRESDETYYDRVAVVGYIQLDEGIEAQLTERKLEISLARLKAISGAAGDEIVRIHKQDTDEPAVERWRALLTKFEAVRTVLESETKKFEKDKYLKRQFEEEALGLLASSLKREAEAAWRLAQALDDEKLRAGSLSHSRERLTDAATAYSRAAKPSRDRHWVWVQSLALRTVIEGALPENDSDWMVAKVVAEDDPYIWGLGSLCELQVLAVWLDEQVAKDQIQQHLDELVDQCSIDDPFPIESTLDQLARYGNWWGVDETLSLPDTVQNRAAHAHAYLEKAWKKKTEST